MTLGLVELIAYLRRHGRERLRARVIAGEISYWCVFALLLWLRPRATLVVFGFPLLAIRTFMMMGNWAQHAFIAATSPEDAYTASITCINTRYNRRCFNDGYHIGHHLYARCHWTEYPAQFERDLERYVARDAIVFEELDFFMVWLLLMTGQWSRLARAYVRLPGAPERTPEQIIALLKGRVQPFPVEAREAARSRLDPAS
jgi:fatty acid desaturase